MKTHSVQLHARNRRRARGLTLIELMIALVLGLMVVGAAVGIFASNRVTYTATENLGRIQEHARIAFELMSRDIREAGGNPCDRNLPIANVVSGNGTTWYTSFNNAMRGLSEADFPAGGATGDRVTGTDAIEIKSAADDVVSVASHNPQSAQFAVTTINHSIQDKDVVMACDFSQAAIFQVTNAQPGINSTIVHNTGASTPGNTTTCLDVSGACPGGLPTTYAFGCADGLRGAGGCASGRTPSTIVRLKAVRWYIGNNSRGGRSLFQARMVNDAGTLSAPPQEVVEGVQNMRLTYLQRPGTQYVDSTAVTDWNTVVAARINLTLLAADRVDGTQLEREVVNVVAVRNRNP